MKASEAGERTHAVQTPCIFQLITPPQRREAGGFFLSEMGGEFFRNGLCGEEGAVEVKRNHDFLFRSHDRLFKGDAGFFIYTT